MIPRPLIAASACLLAVISPAAPTAAPAVAADTAVTADKFGGLVANSPFGTARSGTTASSSNEPLEFRAVLEENGNRIFSIYETATRRSSWVDLNDPVNEFTVKNFDAGNGSLTVEYQGRPLKLALKRAPAVVAPLPVVQPGTVVAQPIRAAGQPGQQAQVVQTPVAPAQLQQIRDEINRRRAARQQPATPAANTPQPPPARP